MKRMLLAMLLCALAVGCSSKPDTPLEGRYSSQFHEITFNTTATANLFIQGDEPYARRGFEADWVRKGNRLTISTRPKFNGRYQINYNFDVINDGAQLAMKSVDITTEATGETEEVEISDEQRQKEYIFNKHN